MSETELDEMIRFTSTLPVGGSLPRPKAPGSDARAREWLPAEPGRPRKPCRLLRRHPELAFAFDELDTFKVHRHRPGFGAGIKFAFHSAVGAREVFCASSLEHDGFRMLELDGSALRFHEQPVLLAYELDGRKRIYRPDALVQRDGALEFLEFKYEVDAAARERKWQAIGENLAAGGYAFRVLTERHLRRSPHHGNLREVFRHRHSRPDRSVADRALDGIRGAGAVTAGEFQARWGIDLGQVGFLIRHGRLSADLRSVPFSDATPVAWSGRGATDPWRRRV
jgi:hypothetical protein